MAVVVSSCACCGKPKFIENQDAAEARVETGEAIFCDACMALPEDLAEQMIRAEAETRRMALFNVVQTAEHHELVMMNGRPVILLGGLDEG